VKAADYCNSLLLWREKWIYLEVKSKESRRYFIALPYGNQHLKNSYQALAISVSVRRPGDMAGCVVGCRTREAGHLLPAVTLALGKEENRPPPSHHLEYHSTFALVSRDSLVGV